MIKKLFIFIAVILISSMFVPNKTLAFTEEAEEMIYKGEVIEIINFGTEEIGDEKADFQELKIKLLTEDSEEILIKNSVFNQGVSQIQYEPYEAGDVLRIYKSEHYQGGSIYSIMGREKKSGLLALAIIFVLVVLAVGKVWGGLSILGMGVSFLVIFKMIIPLIIGGTNPVISALLGSIIIIPTSFYISHGFNTKTHVGVISTFIALVFTGLMAVYFVDAVHLTGYASEEAGFLHVERRGSIDIRGLLIAGIIIGTMGILDDITIGQSSIVEQLGKANKKYTIWDLFKNGMKVGQDHISSMVNTLVLVYAGSSLPLLLLFYDSSKRFTDILEFELIAEEIVRMLVGSVGLVLVAPLATLMAAYAFSKKNNV